MATKPGRVVTYRRASFQEFTFLLLSGLVSDFELEK